MDLKEALRLIKLNSDAEQAVASRLGIQGIVGARCASL
jgi:thioredoxin-like negative regulator of GroEL